MTINLIYPRHGCHARRFNQHRELGSYEWHVCETDDDTYAIAGTDQSESTGAR